MVHIAGDGLIDLSFMPTLKCNLECPHCMYSASPKQGTWLDKTKFGTFLMSINWNDINSIGFYGGEIFANSLVKPPKEKVPRYRSYYRYNEKPKPRPPSWEAYVALVDDTQKFKKIRSNKFRPKWTITNGAWSRARSTTSSVIIFARQYNLHVYISTTPHHKKYQNEKVLQKVVATLDNFSFKKDDTQSRLLPMGRNFTPNWYCTRRCQRLERVRLAVMPNGDVIYQKCDGVYPVIANIYGPDITWEKVKYMMNHQFRCPKLVETRTAGDITWEAKILRMAEQEEKSISTLESSLPARNIVSAS